MFEVGSTVIHPLHGLGTVESIEEQYILGQVGNFANIFFPAESLSILVNVGQGVSMIRHLIPQDEVCKVMEHLRLRDKELPTRSAERYAINLKKIKSCDIYQLAEVVSDLTYLSQTKKISPKEQQLLKQARKILAEEIAFVCKRDQEEVETEIDSICRESINN